MDLLIQGASFKIGGNLIPSCEWGRRHSALRAAHTRAPVFVQGLFLPGTWGFRNISFHFFRNHVNPRVGDYLKNQVIPAIASLRWTVVQWRYSRLTPWSWLTSCSLAVMDNSRLQITSGDELLEWDECTLYATQIHAWVPTAHMCPPRPFVQTRPSKFILFLNRNRMNKGLLRLDLRVRMNLTCIHPSIHRQLAVC